MSDVWRRHGFRWVFVAFLLVASGRTLFAGLAGEHEGPHGPNILIALSSAEIVAAVAFLIEPIERFACAAVIAIFAIATGLSIMAGDFLPIRFAYYGATAIYIVSVNRNNRAPVR